MLQAEVGRQVISKMKALIIEDSKDIAEFIDILLKRQWQGMIINTVFEGITGIETVKTERLDFVIVDIDLPDIIGFEVLRRIRLFSQVPIIICSARDDKKDRIAGFKLGANGYLVKPFKNRDLITLVNSVLRPDSSLNC
jgi:DNA-binding response OmpR family regulator